MKPSRLRVLRVLAALALVIVLNGSWSAFPPCC
jgi:hypothetical protein